MISFSFVYLKGGCLTLLANIRATESLNPCLSTPSLIISTHVELSSVGFGKILLSVIVSVGLLFCLTLLLELLVDLVVEEPWFSVPFWSYQNHLCLIHFQFLSISPIIAQGGKAYRNISWPWGYIPR